MYEGNFDALLPRELATGREIMFQVSLENAIEYSTPSLIFYFLIL